MNSRAEQYRELFDGYIVSTAPADNGDLDAFCPAHENPELSKKPSARINFTPQNRTMYPNGMIACFVCNFTGKKAGLDHVAKIYHQRIENGQISGKERYDRQETRREMKVGGRKPLNFPSITTRIDYEQHLRETPELLEPLFIQRGLTLETIRKHHLGWCSIKHAYSYPIYENGDGKIIAMRLYRPNDAKVKHSWFNDDSHHTPQLFGTKDLKNEPVVILTEGEFDCMLAQQDGFNAVSHNGGAGKFKKEWASFFRDKVVYIAYDNDDAGRKGRKIVLNTIKSITKAVYFIDIPNPEGKNGTDYTDFRIRDGRTPDDFADLMKQAREAGPESSTVSSGVPATGKPVTISRAMNSDLVGVPLEMTVQNIGNVDKYIIPHRIRFGCTADKGEKFCTVCPAQTGVFELNIDKHDDLLSRLIDVRSSEMEKTLVKEAGLKCRDRVTEVESVDQWVVEKVVVTESVDTQPKAGEMLSASGNDAIIIHNVDVSPSENGENYRVVGHTLPNPRDQKVMFMSWVREETKSNIDRFVLTPDIIADLKRFQPESGQSPIAKMKAIANDLGANVAGIVGREDMIMAYDIVWHSVLAFPFGGKIDDRGWVELLVFGDTRTGKTETARKIAQHYKHGKVVSSEGATNAGLVGGMIQPSGSKGWVTAWGVIPANDRRLIVLDEAQSLKDLVKDISNVRSGGTATLVKVGSNGSTARARTRLIWVANPLGSEKLRELANGAITALREFMPQPEDRARFDLGIAVSQEDVGQRAIYDSVLEGARETAYSSEACEALVMWAWSRKEDQILWEKDAERYCLEMAAEVTRKYGSDFELVQETNFHTKLARITVAIAARLFSCSVDGQSIVVNKEHVRAARDFVYMCYDSLAFGLAKASQRAKDDSNRAESKLEDVRQWFRGKAIRNSDVPQYGAYVYNGIRRIEGHFKQRDFNNLIGLDPQNGQECFAYLRDNALVILDTRTGNVRLSRELQELLTEMDIEDRD